VMHFFAFWCIIFFNMGVGDSSSVRDTNLIIEKLQTNYHAFWGKSWCSGCFLSSFPDSFRN
jgi:hypothetical protein